MVKTARWRCCGMLIRGKCAVMVAPAPARPKTPWGGRNKRGSKNDFMSVGLTHIFRELRREGSELAFGSARWAASHWQTARGQGERALLSQAQRIRFTRHERESIAAYRHLDDLIRRYGDAGTGFDVPEESPARFVAFVGYSRSGHSLVGSLLDAHPDAVVAHELHALKHLAAGQNFDTVLHAIRQNARVFQIMGRSYTGYDYAIPGQWQGTCRQPLIVGDKKGNGSTRFLRRHPEALDRILARVPVPVSLIHVIRNPYDNIATKALRTGRHPREAAAIYFANARKIAELKACESLHIHDVDLDSLIADPRSVLRDLVKALGLNPMEPGYLDACAEILFKSPSRTRDRIKWPGGLIHSIDERLTEINFLAHYAGQFDSS